MPPGSSVKRAARDEDETMSSGTSRFVATGAGVFALAGALFGFVWTTTELPFVMALQWAVGLYVLGYVYGGTRAALRAGAVGAIVYLVTFTLALFIALSVFEFPLPTAVPASFASAAAGGVLGGRRGALTLGLAAFIGFAVADFAIPVMAALAPVGTEQPGVAQALWFAAGQALAGLIGGAALGYGFARLARGRDESAVA